ncbi:MAG TPA: hypothetical protein DCF68_20375 [Cyanothece sp. UBA12306]|nr:hypothetical protein [Cyanothece sp. UBA12306]
MKLKSSKNDKDEAEKFLTDVWLAIPKFSNNDQPQESSSNFEVVTEYHLENLLKTFQATKAYTEIEVKENFFNLITECNEKIQEIEPEQDFKIAVEWILPESLLSSPIDCWEYKKNRKIGGERRFFSVHIRSSQRLHICYRDCLQDWKNRWNFLVNHLQEIDESHYISAKQCNQKNDEDLGEVCYDDDKMIVGLNLSNDLQELENISYEELIIETGIPVALWSRAKPFNPNHLKDLDSLINPENKSVLNFDNLPKSIINMRASAKKNQPSHLGHHLCFLWENPYNYPLKTKFRM